MTDSSFPFLANLCSKKLDIIIAADVSGSMDDNQFTQLQTFLSTLVDNIKISKTSGARVIVLAFDDQINSLASSFSDKVTTSRSGIKTQINRLQFTAGSTVIDTVIEEAKDLLSSANRDTAQKVVVFVTDGVNFNGTDSLVLPAQELRDVSIVEEMFSNVVVFTSPVVTLQIVLNSIFHLFGFRIPFHSFQSLKFI